MTVYENIASPLQGRRRRHGQHRPRGAACRRAAQAHALSRPHAAQPVGRTAAAHRDRARHLQERRRRAARRAARQSRLQAARGAARGAAEDLRRERHDLRLRHDRAARGAAARRQYGDAVGRPHHPVRADHRGVPQAERPRHGAHLLRSAAQHHRAAQEGPELPARWWGEPPGAGRARRHCRRQLHDRLSAPPSFARRGRALRPSRSRRRSRSPRSPARKASSTWTSPTCAG